MKKLLIIFLLSLTSLVTILPASDRLDPAVLKRSASVVKEKFPDADNVLLLEKERYVCSASGAYTAYDELYAKVLTESGRRGLRNLSFYFNEHYNRLKVEQITIIKPDGRRENVDIKSNSRVVIDSSQMSSNIYDPASKRLVISIPRLETGDVIYFRTVDEHFKPRIPNFWSNYSLLQSTWPIIENTIEVDLPETMPLRSIAVKDEIKGTVKFEKSQKNGRLLYKWHGKNVPQVLREPGMPELHTCVQRLLVSTAGSWEEVSKWYWQLCRPRLDAVTPAMRQMTARLLKGKSDDMAKIRAIFQYVSQNIRYMGITPEKEAPGYEPHDVKLTFEHKYGVCRDKAALLVSMLELAGFKAYPVLFMAGDPKDDEIPNGYFNHAVTAVEMGKDNYLLMDPTYESTTDLFPAFQADMSYLVAHPRGEKLRRSPIVPAAKNLSRIRSSAEIDAAGVMHGKSFIELYGVNDLYYRGALSRWPEERKAEFFTGRLRRILPGVELESLKILPENIRDMSRPLTFQLEYSVPHNFSNSRWLLMLPELSRVFGINEVIFQDIGLLNRKYPLKFISTCLSEDELTVTIPEKFRILTIPENLKFGVKEKVVWQRSTQHNGRVLKIRNRFALNTLELPGSEYPALKSALHKAQTGAALLPMLENKFDHKGIKRNLECFPGADSVIEKYDLFIDLHNSSSWQIKSCQKRFILNYAGVKSHSEVKIPFVPAWEDVSLKARVTSPDGKVTHLGKSELNIMDSPRNSSGPRYPEGKILVASLPRVTPGSTIEVEVTRTCRNRNFFSFQVPFFSQTAPIIACSLKLSAPGDMYIRSTASATGIKLREYQEKGRNIKIWSISNVPRSNKESSSAPWQLYAPGVLLSSDDNNAYAAKINKALHQKCRESLPDVKSLIEKEKWHTLPPTAETVTKIRDHVDKFIRKCHLPLSDVPLSSLSRAGTTLRSGYGHSADRAILLGAILESLKIKFRFIGSSGIGYTSQTARVFKHSPDPEQLVQDILLYLPDLKLYLNDTSRYAAPGASNNENNLGIDLDTGRLTAIRCIGIFNSDLMMDLRIVCNSDNSAVIQVKEKLFGRHYEKTREFIETATPERLRRFFEEKASAVSHGSTLNGTGGYDLKKYPGILEYKVKVADALLNSGDFRILRLPRYKLLANTLAAPVSQNRQTPYWNNVQKKLTLRYTITPPPGYHGSGTRKNRYEYGSYGSFRFNENYSSSGNSILLRSRLIVPVELISRSGCSSLEKLQQLLMHPAAEKIIFKPASDKSNAR